MAWYPGATKMELQPESDRQPAIRPTQLIVHSIIAPWTARRVYEYWRDSTNLESHFGLGYEGDLGQFIGTETRADANYRANRRPDGTGAVSIETASNLKGSDPWTAAQLKELIKLGAWLHLEHGIPLRICRTHDDPGFGYHRLHSQWAVSGTSCPGDARVRQFKDTVFPGIVARATGQKTEEKEEKVPEMDQNDVYGAVWGLDLMKPPAGMATKENPTWAPGSVLRETADLAVRTEAAVARLEAKLDAILARLPE